MKSIKGKDGVTAWTVSRKSGETVIAINDDFRGKDGDKYITTLLATAVIVAEEYKNQIGD